MRRIIAAHTESERWPIAVDTDCVYYTSDNPDAYAARPAGLRVLEPDTPDRLGWLSIKTSKTQPLTDFLAAKENDHA